MKGLGIGIIIGVFISVAFFYFTSNHVSYTLYRNSESNEEDKIHIASFEAMESERYNRENCEIARGLFQSQPFVRVKYWCDRTKSSF